MCLRVLWTVLNGEDGGPELTSETPWWNTTAHAEPPRTLAWSMGHPGAGSMIRADWLVGSQQMTDGPAWPTRAAPAVAFLRGGLAAWRTGLEQMTDEYLDVVGRCAYPGGPDPELPLMDSVWWVNKELIWHAAEIWYARDLYAFSNR